MGKKNISYSVIENNIFRGALVLSILLHVLLFAKISVEKWAQNQKLVNNIEVTYQRVKQSVQRTERQNERLQTLKKELLETKKKLPEQKQSPSPLIKDLTKMMDTYKEHQKTTSEASSEPKKKVSVPPIKSENMKIPSYVDYYQVIRKKIKERAVTNYVNTDDRGEVYLTFVVSSDGKIVQINLIAERTTASPYLCDISLKSIDEAGPFPVFPANLKYPELPFSVPISYKGTE